MNRGIAVVIALALLAAPWLGSEVAAQEPRVSVLIDFGDGTYLWADVALPEDNATALRATEIANGSLGLPPLEVTWFESPFCVRSPCAFVNDVGERDPVFPLYWHLFLWNATAGQWDVSPFGPSDIDLVGADVIAWYLAVDDPETFASPRPIPTPAFPDVYTRFRGDLRNSGEAHGILPVAPRLLWERDVGVLEIDTSPVVAYGRVYVATRAATVALDASTGEELWRAAEVRSLLSTPSVYDGRLIVGGTDGHLHVVDAETGDVQWSLLLEPGVQSTGIASSPAIHEGRAYIGTFNETANGPGRVVAVNLNNGTIAWTYETASVHMSQPAIANGRLYVGLMGLYDGEIGFGSPTGLLSVNLAGGDPWFFPTDDSVAASPVISDGVVFVPSKDGYLYAVRADGTLAWRSEIGSSTSSPALVGDRLYVAAGGFGSEGAVFAFDLMGNPLWETRVPGAVQASLVSDGVLVCGATNAADGRHFCLDAASGTTVWSLIPQPPQFILGSPVSVGGVLFAVSDNGHVYAYVEGPEGDSQVSVLLVAGVAVTAAVAVGALVLYRLRRRPRA